MKINRQRQVNRHKGKRIVQIRNGSLKKCIDKSRKYDGQRQVKYSQDRRRRTQSQELQ